MARCKLVHGAGDRMIWDMCDNPECDCGRGPQPTVIPSQPEDDGRMVIIVNGGVNMSRGKYAAQAVHAALLAVGAHPHVPVIVLGGKRQDIEALRTKVRDAGRTEVEPGTLTAGTDWRKVR